MCRSALNISLVVAVSVLAPAACLGQGLSSCGVAAMGVMLYGGTLKTNAPFSVTIRTSHEQQLPNGNSIHGTIITHAYRDSVGRVLQQTSTMCAMTLDGQYRPTIYVTVNDLAKRTTTSWQINGREKVVRIRHQEDQPPTPAAPPPTAEQKALIALTQEQWRKNTHSEKLGTRTIAGVSCEDSRQTTTIPSGQQGNDLPMDNIEEVCISRDAGLTMLRINDFPLSGRNQTEVTEYSTGEPDPSVFTPPPGYTIEEVQPKTAANPVSGQ